MGRLWKMGLLAVLPGVLAACGGKSIELPELPAEPGPEPSAKTDEAELTYFADIKPLLDNKCGLCHVEGGVGPMPLETYDQVAAWAPQIQAEIASGRMPPWYAAPGCNEYLGNRSLTDDQKSAVLDWVTNGFPEGNPEDEGEPLPVDESEFRSDITLQMPEEYTPSITPDEYRCFVLPWPKTEPVYITGVGLTPGNEALVHHSVINLVAPDAVADYQARDAGDPGLGYTCFTTSSATALNGNLIGAIEKAEAGRSYPEGTGVLVEPGSVIILQQHYNTLATGEPEPDQSSIEFKLEPTVERPAHAAWLVNPVWMIDPSSMEIPAGQKDVVHSAELPATYYSAEPFELHWADLHMHTLGSGGGLTLIREDGTEECLLDIEDWDFDWQETYFLKQPVTVHPGDRLKVECRWDNRPENQYIVDGKRLETRDVHWGDGSRDEMCLGNFLISSVAP